MENKISVLNFIPKEILCGKNNNSYRLDIKNKTGYVLLSYIINGYNKSKRKHSLILPKYINKNNETFEVLGLLQAEMGKTNNGSLAFCNNEPKIINKVLKWFEKELELSKDDWKWSIAVNIKEPKDKDYKKEVENKLINYWLNKSSLKLEKSFQKKVLYRNTKNIRLKKCYYGCLRIEFKNNLFSQIIKNFVKKTVNGIINLEEKYIRNFMVGILAGESCVEINKKHKTYRIHITANDINERNIYQSCLNQLGIKSKQYNNHKDLIISRRENLVKLLKQRLMTLHLRKYAKFLNMMKQYPNIKEETGYFKPKGKNSWNRIPKEKINDIISLKKTYPNHTCRKIAQLVKVSPIKVSRVLRNQ